MKNHESEESPSISSTAGVRRFVARLAPKIRRGIMREEGATLVETGLAAIAILTVLFGIIEVSYALYTFQYVSSAARQATRYASLRGPNSCNDATNKPFPDCGLSPTKFTSTTDPTKNPLLNYINSLGLPGLNSSNTSVAVKFLVASRSSGTTSWATDSNCSSTSDLDKNGNLCNNVGNMINVKVTYQYTLTVPFWQTVTLPISSTSQMMISE